MRQTFYLKHVERAVFDVPVYCEPLRVRLHPQCDAHATVRSSRIDLSPAGATVKLTRDAANNLGWQVTFQELTVSLCVSVTSVVERTVNEAEERLREETTSWSHLVNSDPVADCYRQRESASETARLVHDELLSREGATPLSYLRALAAETARQYAWDARLSESTGLHRRLIEPRATRIAADRSNQLYRAGASMKSISVRDMAAAGQPLHTPRPQGHARRAVELFAEVARHAGIPTRFVMGYDASRCDEIETRPRIWAECLLDQHGWLGFDPCRGQLAGGSYLALSAACRVDELTTLQGEFRGGTVNPQWSTQIIVREGRHEVVA